jgi:potassium efflux system protein
MELKQTSKFEWLSYVRLAVIATSVLLGLSGDLTAAQNTPEVKTSTTVSQSTPDEPKLSEIIPLSAELSARLAKLENIKLGLSDLAAIEKDYSEIDERINVVSKKVEDLRSMRTGQNVGDIRHKIDFTYEEERLKKINVQLVKAIETLDAWDREWRVEKQRWKAWQSSSVKDRSNRQILTAFDAADSTIASALGFISEQMEPLLAAQSNGARLKAKMDGLVTKTTSRQEAVFRREPLRGKTPPIYSPDYYAQFNRDTWGKARENLMHIPRPGDKFFILHALELGILVFILMLVFALIYRKRQIIAATENWSFVADRPFSTALFITSLVATVRMSFWATPSMMVNTFFWVTGSMSCLRLLVKVLQSRWAKKASCGVMFLCAVTVVLNLLGPPAPIFNLFILVASAVILVLALKLAAECSLSESGPCPYWGARILALWFAVILIAQILGYTGFAYSMFVRSVISMAVTALFVLFIYLLRGGIHWVFFSSPLWQIKLLRSDAHKNERKVRVMVEVVITLFLILPAILYIWNLFDSYPDALSGLFAPGFDLGGQRITVGLIIAALTCLYGSFYVSQIAPKILLDEQTLGRHMDRGVRGSIGHLARYIIIFIGLLLTFLLLGFSLTNITIILSALGVGIGFGLQGIVNNFVSGLILLFERPIREGDTIVLGEQWARVKKIGMRATIIETFDESEMVVPNADMINNHVTNWTLSNRQVRLSVPVGVDYGSDVPLVVETLLACANDNSSVMDSPAPEALFLNLGESSLDFKLRVWIPDADNINRVKSQLYHEIFKRFREKGIAIPFPQRDLHLYGVGRPGIENLKKNLGEELLTESDPA